MTLTQLQVIILRQLSVTCIATRLRDLPSSNLGLETDCRDIFSGLLRSFQAS
jgi:hypothetical protein